MNNGDNGGIVWASFFRRAPAGGALESDVTRKETRTSLRGRENTNTELDDEI